MSRLIDADDIVLDYSGLVNIPPLDFRGIAEYFAKQIDAMPTIETERKVGRWTIEAIDITNDDGRRSYGFYRCSVCKCVSAPSLFVPSEKWLKYCPNCGAKMNEIT